MFKIDVWLPGAKSDRRAFFFLKLWSVARLYRIKRPPHPPHTPLCAEPVLSHGRDGGVSVRVPAVLPRGPGPGPGGLGPVPQRPPPPPPLPRGDGALPAGAAAQGWSGGGGGGRLDGAGAVSLRGGERVTTTTTTTRTTRTTTRIQSAPAWLSGS